MNRNEEILSKATPDFIYKFFTETKSEEMLALLNKQVTLLCFSQMNAGANQIFLKVIDGTIPPQYYAIVHVGVDEATMPTTPISYVKKLILIENFSITNYYGKLFILTKKIRVLMSVDYFDIEDLFRRYQLQSISYLLMNTKGENPSKDGGSRPASEYNGEGQARTSSMISRYSSEYGNEGKTRECNYYPRGGSAAATTTTAAAAEYSSNVIPGDSYSKLRDRQEGDTRPDYDRCQRVSGESLIREPMAKNGSAAYGERQPYGDKPPYVERSPYREPPVGRDTPQIYHHGRMAEDNGRGKQFPERLSDPPSTDKFSQGEISTSRDYLPYGANELERNPHEVTSTSHQMYPTPQGATQPYNKRNNTTVYDPSSANSANSANGPNGAYANNHYSNGKSMTHNIAGELNHARSGSSYDLGVGTPMGSSVYREEPPLGESISRSEPKARTSNPNGYMYEGEMGEGSIGSRPIGSGGATPGEYKGRYAHTGNNPERGPPEERSYYQNGRGGSNMSKNSSGARHYYYPPRDAEEGNNSRSVEDEAYYGRGGKPNEVGTKMTDGGRNGPHYNGEVAKINRSDDAIQGRYVPPEGAISGGGYNHKGVSNYGPPGIGTGSSDYSGSANRVASEPNKKARNESMGSLQETKETLNDMEEYPLDRKSDNKSMLKENSSSRNNRKGGPYQQGNNPVIKINDGILMHINKLSQYSSKWIIKARVQFKDVVRKYYSGNKEGKVFSIELCDEDGEIKVNFFGKAVDKWYDYLQLGKIYKISKGYIKAANKKFTTVKHDYEITLDENSIIEVLEENDNIPKFIYKFTTIDAVKNMKIGSLVDVIGVVFSYQESTQILIKKTGQYKEKRDIVLIDDSKETINVTLWGDHALNTEEVYLRDNSIICFKNLKVGEWQGIKLESHPKTKIDVKPDIERAHMLNTWWINNKQNLYSTVNVGAGIFHMELQKTIEEIKKDVNLANEDALSGKGIIFTTFGFIDHIYNSIPVYSACPDCNKKMVSNVVEEEEEDVNSSQMMEQSMYCSKCNKNNTPIYSYFINLKITDNTDSLRATAFAGCARTIMNGLSANEFMALRQEYVTQENIENFDLIEKAKLNEFFFRIKAYMTSHMDELKKKYTIVDIVPMNKLLVDNCKYLIRSIRSLTEKQ
ncbi:Replication factor a related protein [Plasmodium coatneyi]|uniref:Replication factor a related protein n=1 Tax=Plasmodium coatneyi TaxID=208452 RepID=A0A1B1DUB6_9APIC|nr:Replication factor a related protein [Plasmodium coatneyi]ANQ06239.1 Replication factor a related protein [Plasmodium coatneyi]